MTQQTNNATSPARRRLMATPTWVRRLRYWFSRENLREFFTTLGLVVPLTVLIWIWAEREQTLESDVQVSVDVRSRNPSTVVSLARGDDRTGPASVSVKVSGPKVGVDSLKAMLANDSTRSRMTLEVADDVGADGTRDVAVQPLLDQQNLFRDFGITVRATEPDTLKVRADPVVTQELRPTVPAELASRVESIVTEPATIRVRGSAAALERLKKADKLRADLDLAARAEVRDKEPGTQVDVPNVAIRPLDTPGVTIEPPTVAKATLVFSVAGTGELPSVVVNLSQPSALGARVKVTPSNLQRVKLIGPPDVLRQLTLLPDGDDNKPYAALRVTRADIGKSGRRAVTFPNLPPGVRAVEVPEVQFEVAPATDDVR